MFRSIQTCSTGLTFGRAGRKSRIRDSVLNYRNGTARTGGTSSTPDDAAKAGKQFFFEEEPKNFASLLKRPTCRGAGEKVFCFFFSKKKACLFRPAPALAQ
jgi:hypothetical protein